MGFRCIEVGTLCSGPFLHFLQTLTLWGLNINLEVYILHYN